MYKKMKNVFRYKGVKLYLKSSVYTNYITKRRYKLMGILKFNERENFVTIIDKNHNEYFVIELELKKQNGLNDEIDKLNYSMVLNAKDSIKGKTKTVFLTENSNCLKENIEYGYMMHDCEQDEEIKKDILDRIQYLEKLNKNGEDKCYMFIEFKDFEIALKTLSIPYYYKVLDKAEVTCLLFKLHNLF